MANPGVIVSSGNVASDALRYQSQFSSSSKTPSSVDPVAVALAVRSIRISIDAMQAQYFQSSFLTALA